MSFFGKNIKKIRGIRNLSQQAFAELFDLKRATLGAYEEQRSEPRIETIIKIANYFSIPIDDLLTTELTVNALLKFKGDFTTDTTEIAKGAFPEIRCVTAKLTNDYPFSCTESTFINALPRLQLPLDPVDDQRAFEVQNLEMTSNDRGFYPNDIVIGEKVPVGEFDQVAKGAYCVVITSNAVIFRRWHASQNEVSLRADHQHIADLVLQVSEIKELWLVRHVFCKRIPDFSNRVEDRLTLLQQEVQRIHELLK